MNARSEDLSTWQPVQPPRRDVLAGQLVRLEPIDPENHAPLLYRAAQGPDADPRLWDYMNYGPFDEEEFSDWLKTTAESRDPLFFAIVDEKTGDPEGMAAFLRITPEHGVMEIGHIWFGSALQRTPRATEAIFLMARHTFDDLGYRRLEWKCDASNARSRRAAERFGFRFEGVFRQHMVIKGRNRDTAWFAILDQEWPVLRAAFERWLDPENFDEGGGQSSTLSELRHSGSREATPRN